ncbi:MAG: chemotaxis protein CheD [Deltaproteobacteria bacterium]|nr:chemotaxis protein CheD [Deltaproteobacteria bacterium]
MTTTTEIEVYRYHLQPGYIFSTVEPSLVTAIVGTCVAVCLHDRRLKTGGINHFLYPKAGWLNKTTPQFGDVAIPALIRMMLSQGSRIEDLEAQIIGGASKSWNDLSSDIGKKNVKIARKILKSKGIPIVSEDVGGLKGRRIVFHTMTNETIIMKTNKLRRGDFYPYRERITAN